MKTKKVILFDGQTLDKENHKYLYQFHATSEADIFTMYKSKLVLNYVGYIEFIINDILHEIYCFPKEYNVCINKRPVTGSSELTTEEQVIDIEKQFTIVIKSIIKASQAEKTVGQNEIEKFYASNLHYLNEIITHYNQYGILVEVEKEYTQAPTGKINWNKTIGKMIPMRNNGNFIYDKFVIEKKNTNITFLTQMIAKVILEGTTKYSFYLPIIDTGIDYSELRGITNEVAITRLYELKNKTFKDYLHHVIDNLVSYLQNDTVSSNSGVLVGTNNYNFVWEHVVAHGLGKNFKKTEPYEIGTYRKYDQSYGKIPSIQLDHINENKKIMVDSKYYNDKESEGIDYKQLFYNYHLVFLSMRYNLHNQYHLILKEYKQWKNVLIKPTRETGEIFSRYKLEDNIRLYSLKINTRDYVEYYVTNEYEGKSSFEIEENLTLEEKIEELR